MRGRVNSRVGTLSGYWIGVGAAGCFFALTHVYY